MTETADALLVAVRLDDLGRLMSLVAAGQWNRVDHPEISESWHRLTEAKDAAAAAEAPALPQAPGLPPGDYGCVHIMGHEQRAGWVSDGSIAGAACLDVRDEDGRLIAKVPPHSVYMYEPRIPPRVLAAASRPLAELPAGHYEDFYDEAAGEDQDAEPADAFPARTEPDPF